MSGSNARTAELPLQRSSKTGDIFYKSDPRSVFSDQRFDKLVRNYQSRTAIRAFNPGHLRGPNVRSHRGLKPASASTLQGYDDVLHVFNLQISNNPQRAR